MFTITTEDDFLALFLQTVFFWTLIARNISRFFDRIDSDAQSKPFKAPRVAGPPLISADVTSNKDIQAGPPLPIVPPANTSDGTADAPVGWQARTRRRRLPEKQYALLDRSSGPGRLSCGVADQDEEKKLPAAAVEASKLSWEQEEQVAVLQVLLIAQQLSC